MEAHHQITLRRIAGDESRLAIGPYAHGAVSLHGHDCFELAYVTSGTGVHTLDGQQTILQAGDYFIIDYGSLHSYANGQDLTVLNCLFLPEAIDETLAGCRSLGELMRACLMRYHPRPLWPETANRICRDETGQVLALLRGLKQEYEQKQLGYREVIRSRLTEILILWMRQSVADTQSPGAAASPMIQEALAYLGQHGQDKTPLGDFCRERHYSLPYVSRRFREETGMTARDYLQKKRIEKSCRLLTGSEEDLSLIAQQAGYQDVKFFTQVFKRLTGMTPGAYRKMVRRG